MKFPHLGLMGDTLQKFLLLLTSNFKGQCIHTYKYLQYLVLNFSYLREVLSCKLKELTNCNNRHTSTICVHTLHQCAYYVKYHMHTDKNMGHTKNEHITIIIYLYHFTLYSYVYNALYKE